MRLIEDLALIGDLHTAALVARDGAIEWLCLPRFDSDACFAALLGDRRNGCWTLAPAERVSRISRRYQDETLVLETTMETEGGAVRIVDFMPRRDRFPTIVRLVEGIRGRVEMETKVALRFNFGNLPPWVRWLDGGFTFTVGEDAAILRSSVELKSDAPDAGAQFTLEEGERARFVLQWYPSHEDPPRAIDVDRILHETQRLWKEWSGGCTYEGPYREAVVRSLIALKALTYEPSGGCIAAATTSLPERLGGDWNWDYRYAWIRDSALTIDALVSCGYEEEARAWRDWLLRMLAGAPERLQIMYTVTGGRRIEEYEATWLDGYERSKPVRIGNAAYEQFQLGIYGYLMDAVLKAQAAGIELDEDAWQMLARLLAFVTDHWCDPDSGIWELRGDRRHYTNSRVMAWVAFDRAIQAAQHAGRSACVDEWQATRQRILDDVCHRGFSAKQNAFVRQYGSEKLDASMLMVPIMGFLPIGDSRVAGTLAAVERELLAGGFVLRTSDSLTGGVPNEGAFLACSFWLVQNYALAGRRSEATALFERLIALCNDVGLLSEEYDAQAKRSVGNFPQTFSHATLVHTAVLLAEQRV